MFEKISNIFDMFVQRNILVIVVILAVLLARMLLCKMPKKYSYVLWSIVGIRMLFNLPIASRFSIFNLFQHLTRRIFPVENMLWSAQTHNPINSPDISGHLDTSKEALPFTGTGSLAADAVSSMRTEHIVLGILGIVWLFGIALFLAYGVFSYIKCRMLVRTAVILNDVHLSCGKHEVKRISVWECDCIPSPFVIGIFRPRIYIPFRMNELEQTYILAHEQYHIRRLDPLWKLIGFLLLTVYWWNPLAWIAFWCMVRDMEMSCDEAVIEKFGSTIKQGYSNSLLSFAMERHPFSFAPVAFGEGDAGRRIRNVLNFKKPQTWVAIIVILLLIIVGISCLTNRKDDNQTLNTQTQSSEQDSSEKTSDLDSQNQKETQEAADITALPEYSALEQWAKAFEDRDIRTIKMLATANALNDLKRQELLDDNDNFGWSSPWPWPATESGLPSHQIVNIAANNQIATILYYSQVSDPHVTVWAETLYYTYKDSKLEVKSEELHQFNAIAGGAEFEAAYPNGITDTMMDYQKNGLGEIVNEHATAANGTAPDGQYDLTDPIQAAHYFLNLLPNDSKVEISEVLSEDSSSIRLTVHFTEDDVTRHIQLIHPWNDGIWIVADIS